MNIKNLIQEIKEDHNTRRIRAIEEFKRHYDCTYSGNTVRKLLELRDFENRAFLSLLSPILHWSDINSLEGLEEFNSFIGNFFDDATFKVESKVPDNIKDLRKRARSAFKNVFKKKTPLNRKCDRVNYAKIYWSNDDCKSPLNEKKLTTLIDEIIQYYKGLRVLREKQETIRSGAK
jgi:hypothetical protein